MRVTSWLREDSDMQMIFVKHFLKQLVNVPKTLFWNENFAWISSIGQIDVDHCLTSSGFKVPSVTGMTNNNVVTLSWLLAQDLPQAYIFTERPSTFNRKAAFINDKKYIIYDYLPSFTEDSKHLKAMKACPVAGSKFPILVTRDINPLIREVRIDAIKN